MLYQKLFDKVGHGGDVLSRMREILPQIDGNEPLLQKILPRISGGNIVKESVGKKTDKATPAKEKDIIRKIGPKDKSGLHKNLLK